MDSYRQGVKGRDQEPGLADSDASSDLEQIPKNLAADVRSSTLRTGPDGHMKARDAAQFAAAGKPGKPAAPSAECAPVSELRPSQRAQKAES